MTVVSEGEAWQATSGRSVVDAGRKWGGGKSSLMMQTGCPRYGCHRCQYPRHKADFPGNLAAILPP